jgi:hypothetical protein
VAGREADRTIDRLLGAPRGSSRIRRASATIGRSGGEVDTGLAFPAARQGETRIRRSTIGGNTRARSGAPTTDVADSVAVRRVPGEGRIIRRTLIPEAAAAFATAEAVNPKFTRARTDTDQLAPPADQTTLTSTRPLWDWSGESDAGRRINEMVRAVVLAEYSDRLRPLETAKGPDGQPLSDDAKRGKRATYLRKATEFRDKHIPLLAAGPAAPETRSFLRGYGLSTERLDASGAAEGVALQHARIDVRSTFIGGDVLGVRLRSHLFIVYTSRTGQQFFFRGEGGRDGMTVARSGEYMPSTIDWDPSAPSVTVLEGPEAERKLDSLEEAAGVIDGMKVPYRALAGDDFGQKNLAGKLLSGGAGLVSSAGENCNSVAFTILTRAGIPTNKPAGLHPGWGSILGTRTEGKQNALPPAEAPMEAKPYVLDESRERVLTDGRVPVFADRSLFRMLGYLAVKTKVELLEERPNARRIRHEGKVGFVPRQSEDTQLEVDATYIRLLRESFPPAQIQQLIDEPGNTALRTQVSNATGIPDEHLIAIAQLVIRPGQGELFLLSRRLHNLGQDRVRELVDNPAELAWLAAKLGVDPAALAEQAAALLKEEARLAQLLLRHLPFPDAANRAVNQLPDHPVIEKIAAELGVAFEVIFDDIDRRRPRQHRHRFLRDLMASDPGAKGPPPLPAGVVARLAAVVGVPPDFAARQIDEVAKAQARERRALRDKAAARTPLVPLRFGILFGLIKSQIPPGVTGQDLWEMANDFPEFKRLAQLARVWRQPVDEVRTVVLEKYRPQPDVTDLANVLRVHYDPKTIAAFANKTLPADDATKMAQELVKRTGLPTNFVAQKTAVWHQLST